VSNIAAAPAGGQAGSGRKTANPFKKMLPERQCFYMVALIETVPRIHRK
jgi:hypothetical protein